MSQRTWTILATLATAMILAAASGCTRCDVDRHARAQGLDGGAPATRPGPMTTATCYVRAQRQTTLLDTQITELCFGAPTPAGPVECFLAARSNLMLTDPQKIALCHCALSSEPVDCYVYMRTNTMLVTSQIESVCSPTISQGLLSNCQVIGGYAAGGYGAGGYGVGGY